MTEKILCVDDDPRVLSGMRRQLSTRFDLATAEGPLEGLKKVDAEGPFAVVISDMRMPEMNGVEFLAEVRARHSDSVRIILTGHADLQTTIEAVNEGHIFRFLSKPCATETLIRALDDGIRQYGLIRAEKELVEGTLTGSVAVLSDVLSLVNPLAFGRAARIKRLAQAIGSRLQLENLWQLEIAGMLSQLGCVTMPESSLQDLFDGKELHPDAQRLYEQHPEVAGQLLRKIPRLEQVARIIAAHCPPHGTRQDRTGLANESVEVRVLQLAADYDAAESRCGEAERALLDVEAMWGGVDPPLLSALREAIGQLYGLRSREVRTVELAEGMVLAADVMTTDGRLLVAKGQEVTFSLRQRLVHFHKNGVVAEPLLILEPEDSCAVPVAAVNAEVHA